MNIFFRTLVVGAVLLAVPSVSLAQPSAAEPSLNPALVAAADSFAALSRPTGPPRAWADQSDAARIAQRARADRVLAMLSAVPSAALSTSAERLLHENLIEVSDGGRGSRVCRFHLWYSPNPFAGWHIAASNWARNVQVGDSARRVRALDALRALPGAIRDERALLERGLDSGYVSSQQVIDVAVRQFRDLLTDDIARSPLAAPLTRDTASAFAAAWTAVLRDSVYPVARDYASWLERSYRPSARTDGSLRGLPDGRACYSATMRQSTSVDLDPESLMDEARREIARLHTALAPMIRSATGLGVADGIRALKTDPRFTYSSRDTILAAYRAMTALAATRIDRVVAGYQPESVVVIPYPEFQERAGLPPSYQRAPDDRSRPAWFLINLGRPERMAVGNAAAHEAYPGHHLQRIAASQATSIHPVMRNLFVSAFSEGWGIYSEDLGAEMGLYTTELDSIGHLVHILDVAVAYYLDAGTHVRGWTRAMLVDSMYAIGGRTRAQATDYADRHAATPGQLATYYVGYRVIRAARADAERRLGARFDLPQFNREVLKDGTITLASLQAKLESWVRAREARGDGALPVAAAPAPLRYTVDLRTPADRLFHVTLEVDSLPRNGEIFNFAATAPGTYQVMDIGRFVRNFRATDAAGAPIAVERVSTNRWRLATPERVRTIRYEMATTFDTPVREHTIYKMAGTVIRDDHAMINGQAVFGFPDGMQSAAISVRLLTKPEWTIGTALDPVGDEYLARNYDHLVDSPILMGRLTRARLDVTGVPVEVYAYSPTRAIPADSLLNAMSAMLNAAGAFLGKLPVDRYAFLYLFGDANAGAWEHSNSSTYVLREVKFTPAYGSIITDIAAHEFFHIVTPLNLHSEIIEHFDFATPTPSRHLWLYEGVTEWAAHKMQLEAQLKTPADYLASVADKFRRDRVNFDTTYSLGLMSMTSYAPEGQRQFGNIYSRGALVGAILDIALLEESNGERGLQTLIDVLTERYGRDRAFPEDSLFDVIGSVTSPRIRLLLDSLVAGTERPPVRAYYEKLGIRLIEDARGLPVRFEMRDDITAEQRRLRDAWLRGTRRKPAA